VAGLGTLASISAAKAAVALAGTGEAVGRLFAGSAFALLVLLVVLRWGRRLTRRLAPVTTAVTTPARSSVSGTDGQAA
jgi:hypothetical protein